MFCAISGDVPQEPVVAKTTGLLFEKRLILKSLKEERKCPVTRTDLSEDDLLPVAANPIPPLRPAAPTSLPNLLHSMQEEWDETVLETFTLRQQLDTTRKELAHALYQYDAACRVIARLSKERDSAFALLKNFQAAAENGQPHRAESSSSSSARMEEEKPHEEVVSRQEEIGISEEVVEELNAVCKKLSSGRKGRKPSEFLQTKDSMAQIQEIQQYRPHKDRSHEVLCLSLNQQNDSFSVLTGSSDHSIVMSDYSTGQIHCKMNGHKGAVNCVAFSPENAEIFFSGSDDRTVRIWHANSSGGFSERQSLLHTADNSGVSALAVHPSGHYLVSTTRDGSWNFFSTSGHRQAEAGLLKTTRDDRNNNSAACFHPDGLILGIGTSSGALRVWDIREPKHVTDLKDSSSSEAAAVQSLSFSENGYLSAAGYDNGEVKIWDLRKLTCVKTFQFGSSAIKGLSFDYSGVYLGIGGGTGVQVKVVKDWSTLATIANAHENQITQLAWTTNALSLVSSSTDGTLRVFGNGK